MRQIATQTFMRWDAAEWEAIGVWLTGLVTIGLLVYAALQVRQTRIARDDQTRPFVVVDFHFRSSLVSLSVKNVGATAAVDVRVVLDDEVKSAGLPDVRWQGKGVFGEGVPLFAPGREMVFSLDMFGPRHESALPMRFTGTVHYSRPRHEGKPYVEPFVLDLSVFEESNLPAKDLIDLVDEVVLLRKEVHKWTNGNSGLLVGIHDQDKQAIVSERPYHFMKARQARESGGWGAFVNYFVKQWRRRHGWWSR